MHRPSVKRLLVVGLAVLVVLGAFTAWQAMTAARALKAVASGLAEVNQQVRAGDVEKARSLLDEAADDAATARSRTRGPVWWAATGLPGIGDDVTAVRTVAEVSDDLTHDTLPDLLQAGADLTPASLRPTGGSLRLAPLSRAAPVLERGSVDLADYDRRVDDLEVDGLSSALRGPVEDLGDKLGRAADLAQRAATALAVLPSMLGADGPRTYLLMFQNNAEIRAGGGLAGAYAIIEVRDGQIDLTRQSRPAEVGIMDPPVGDLTDAELALFTDRPGVFPADTVMVPHFPRSADLMSRMWEVSQGQRLDGVMSMDPVALSYLLRGTGPIDSSRGQITADNAVDELLRDTYLEIPTDTAQNAFFATVAKAVFARVVDNPQDPRALLDALVRAVDERRLMVWSAVPREQRILERAAIAGVVPSDETRAPELGVYLNDSGSDKLTYYLDHEVQVRPRSCSGSGAQLLDVRLSMTSSVPPGELTPYVVGPGTPGLPLGDMRLTAYLYAPVEGRVESATLDGNPVELLQGRDRDRDVGALTVDIERGQTRVVDYVVRTGRGQSGRPHVLTTPGVRGSGVGTVGPSAC